MPLWSLQQRSPSALHALPQHSPAPHGKNLPCSLMHEFMPKRLNHFVKSKGPVRTEERALFVDALAVRACVGRILRCLHHEQQGCCCCKLLQGHVARKLVTLREGNVNTLNWPKLE